MKKLITPLLIATILSVVVILIVLFVWLDNKQGFREAGNAASLLSSLFGALSFVWLVATVLMQRDELRLQRVELSLQRKEMRELTEANRAQAELMVTERNHTVRSKISNDLRELLKTESQSVKTLVSQIMSDYWNFAKQQNLQLQDEDLIYTNMGDDCIQFKINPNIKSEENKLNGNGDGDILVKYTSINATCLSRDRLAVPTIEYLYRTSVIHDSEKWFRLELAKSLTGDLGGINSPDVFLLLNAIAVRAAT